MRKTIVLLIVFTLFLTGCNNVNKENNIDLFNINDGIDIDVNPEEFNSLNDENLLQFIEDDVYAGITDQLASEDYKVESVDAIYISKEYLEEIEYNSKENIYFGYTLSELDKQYDGLRYIFTLGDDGKTTTKTFEKYDDTYEKIIKNITVGSGVILVCATVSVVSAGVGAPAAVSMVFMASAKTGTAFALSTGTLSSAATAIVTGIETKDVEKTVKAAMLSGSENFKWGAITGVVTGGASETVKLVKSARSHPTYRKSELDVLDRIKGGKEQVSYLNGEKVASNIKGSTRPDVVVQNVDGTVKAIEVKNYDLSTVGHRNSLYIELKRQVTNRVNHLPTGSTQEIVLDIRGRNYSKNMMDKVVNTIKLYCSDVYDDIPVTVMRY